MRSRLVRFPTALQFSSTTTLQPSFSSSREREIQIQFAEPGQATRLARQDRHRPEFNRDGRSCGPQAAGLSALDELCGLLQGRNELFWVRGEFAPPNIQFDFNCLWFDAPF